MKLISPVAHGWLDYLTVLVFLLAPAVLGLSGFAAVVSYVLAAVHLVLTLATAFPPGAMVVVPLNMHGGIELLVGIVLTVGGLVLGVFTELLGGGETTFYVIVGIVILAVWVLTDYGTGQSPAGRSREGPASSADPPREGPASSADPPREGPASSADPPRRP